MLLCCRRSLFRQGTSHGLRRRRRLGFYHGGTSVALWLTTAQKHITLSGGTRKGSSSSSDGGHQHADCGPQVYEHEEMFTSTPSLRNAVSPRNDKETERRNKEEESELHLLRASGITLRDAAEVEIKAEVERDCREGVAAIPPLPPSGWKVQHPAGSNYFVMTRVLYGGVVSAEPHTRQYLSVHDTFLQAMKEGKKQHQKGDERRGQQQQQRQSLSDVNVKEAVSSAVSKAKVEVGYSTQKERRAVLRKIEETLDESRSVKRADVHLTLFAPFRVYDPSLHDPSVDVCEWSSFDVLIQKTSTSSGDCPKTTQNSLNSLAHLVADKALCMFVRLASVNSEMRIRSIQLLSRDEARALEEHACFGQGDPIFLELLHHRRQSSVTRRHLASVRCYDEPTTSLKETPNSKPWSTGILNTGPLSTACNTAHELLVNCFDSGGEYSRTLCYGGPHVSELSKEMVEVLQSYLQGDLGLSPRLCEYVCQMQFFLEQEEYTAWLGRLRHVAAVVSERT